MRRKTYNSQCTVCGQWYLTDVDPVKIVGAVTPDRRLYLSEMQTGETTDNATNSTAKVGANVNRRIDTKKIVVQPNHYFFKYYM